MNSVVFNATEAPETVLVVDDYDDARASMRDILEDLGQHVTEAANGRDALHFLIFHREVKVKLIILDLQMPTMNGWEFLTLMRSYVRLALIPVVIASAHASSLPPPHAPPVLGCLKLPYQPKELSAVLQIVNNNGEQS